MPRLVVDHEHRGLFRYGVRYSEMTDNGFRYSAIRTPLPVAAEGGHPDTHAVVTVFGPDGSSAYVFEYTGHLSESYVAEKLGPQPQHLPVVTELVRHILDR